MIVNYDIPKQGRGKYQSATNATGTTQGATTLVVNTSGLSADKLTWLARMMQAISVVNGEIVINTNLNVTGDVTPNYIPTD